MDFSGAIVFLLDAINAAVATIGNDPLLTASLAGAIPTAYDFVILVHRLAVAPVGYTLLAFLLLSEIYQILTKDGGFAQGTKAMESVIVIFIQMVALKVVIDAAPKLLELLYSAGMAIARGVSSLAGGAGSSGLTIPTQQVIDSIGGDFGVTVVVSIILVIVWFISVVTGYVAKGILIGRFVELYIMLAFSPIPLATLPSSELRYRGLNFLVHFFALSIQAAVVMVIMYLFPAIVGEALTNFDWSDWLGGTVLFTFYSVVLCVLVFMSNGISKKILGSV